jgi:serine/threonine protein kinase
MPQAVRHPTPQQLSAYGLGKLPERARAAIARHLEGCAACRQAVANLPPDSFMGKLRAAAPSNSALPAGPARSDSAPSRAARSAATAAVPKVPPELASHPKFRIVRELGRGGMGVVYEAEHTVMGRRVAIKVMNPAVFDHPDALARFHGEVRAAGKLDHDNIVRAHDADQAGNLHLLVMEFVEGVTLAQLVHQRGPLSVADACRYVHQAALGLQHAFERGMAHRDIKPQNLMLTAQGRVKVLDFGLARVRSERGGSHGMTKTGAFMGTPDYVAPEQALDAHSADTRADIYSLGCTLYFLLTGKPPFEAESLYQLLYAHQNAEAKPLHTVRGDVPVELAAVVARMLAKSAAQRYQTPIEAARALAPFIRGGSATPGSVGSLSLPPGMASPTAGTRVGNTTSCGSGLGHAAARQPAKGPPAPEELADARQLLARSTVISAKGPPAPEELTAPVGKGRAVSTGVGNKGKSARAGWWNCLPVLVCAGAAVLALAATVWIVAGFVLKVTTDDGKAVVVLEIDQQGVQVVVDGQTIKVDVPGESKPVEIRALPGQHKLRVSKDGFVTFTQDAEFQAGKSALIKAHLEPIAPPPPPPAPVAQGKPPELAKPVGPSPAGGKPGGQPEKPAASQAENAEVRPETHEGPAAPGAKTTEQAGNRVPAPAPPAAPQPPPTKTTEQAKNPESAADGFVRLFNGKDLSGWRKVASETMSWAVENGVLVGKNGEGAGTVGYLVTERSDYGDFWLGADVSVSAGRNTVLGFRSDCSAESPLEWKGYEVHLPGADPARDSAQHTAGSLGIRMPQQWPFRVLRHAAEVPLARASSFRLDVIAQGSSLTIRVEDRKVVDDPDAGSTFTRGAFKIMCRPGNTIEFRKIVIKELPPHP